MVKKNESIFGRPVALPDFGFSVTGGLIPVSGGDALGADGSRMQHELDQQLGAMDAFTIKALVGMEKMGAIQRQAGGEFLATCEVISQEKQQAQGTDYQAYVDEFSHHLMALSGQQMMGCVKVAGAGIAREIAQSPHPPPEPKLERRTWFGRLLLGG